MNSILYTIGTDKREIFDFLRLLKEYEIEKLIDVRRFPTSKFDHFKSENLKGFLAHQGVEYVGLGDLLGGYRKGGYEQYMKSEDFKRGVDLLEREASERRTALVCAEIVPWRCHRRFIAHEMMEKGWKVIHIIDHKRRMEEK